MFYMYILKSKRDGELYIGYTSNLKRRFAEHNSGQSKSTKGRAPFDLVYYEAYKSQIDAMHREISLKLRGKALGQLKRRIKDSLERCGGKGEKARQELTASMATLEAW